MNTLCKIIYVDDEALNLKLFKINFKNKYEIFTAENGTEGLKVLEEHPDVLAIISDMRMPEMTGLEFIKIAKERFPSKKFYILTGFDITPEIKEALQSGLIIKYFKKPFDLDEIDGAIAEAIKELEE